MPNDNINTNNSSNNTSICKAHDAVECQTTESEVIAVAKADLGGAVCRNGAYSGFEAFLIPGVSNLALTLTMTLALTRNSNTNT